MIQVTRLNNQGLYINSDLIKYLEQAPDTVITLLNGEKFIVREPVSQVVERVAHYRRSLLRGMCPNFERVPVVAPGPGDENEEDARDAGNER